MSRPPSNPFYVLVVVSGMLFVLTAFANAVAMARAPGASEFARRSGELHPLFYYLDHHGTTLLFVELALLGIGTFGAIGWDRLGTRRAAGRRGWGVGRRDEKTGEADDD